MAPSSVARAPDVH